MSSPNFSSILHKQADDVKPPPLIPSGTYTAVIVGLPEQVESSKKKTPGLRFTFRIIAADEDVSQDDLDAFEGGVAGKMIKNDMWMTEDPVYFENNLKSLIQHCGIDLSGKSLGEGLDETPNSQVRIFVKHEPSEDGQRMFAKVGRTLPAED